MKPQLMIKVSSAWIMLSLFLSEFEKKLEDGVSERSAHAEYVDATDVLVSMSGETADALAEWMVDNGAWVPSSILEKLQESARHFWRAAARAKFDDKRPPGPEALKARGLLTEAVGKYEVYLEDEGIIPADEEAAA
jgi:hypothetical protein